MRVQVSTPEEFYGAINNDLSRRRGEIQGMESRGRHKVLTAKAPLSEMFGYATDVRSLSQGRASYSMEPHSYAPVPPAVAKAILAAY